MKKNYSLEEARKTGEIDRFCREHPSKGDAKCFDELLLAMAKKQPEGDQTSDPDASAC